MIPPLQHPPHAGAPRAARSPIVTLSASILWPVSHIFIYNKASRRIGVDPVSFGRSRSGRDSDSAETIGLGELLGAILDSGVMVEQEIIAYRCSVLEQPARCFEVFFARGGPQEEGIFPGDWILDAVDFAVYPFDHGDSPRRVRGGHACVDVVESFYA